MCAEVEKEGSCNLTDQGLLLRKSKLCTLAKPTCVNNQGAYSGEHGNRGVKSNTLGSMGAKDRARAPVPPEGRAHLFSSYRADTGWASEHPPLSAHGNKEGPGALLPCASPLPELFHLNTSDGAAV